MTIVVTGSTLTLDELVAVARRDVPVALGPQAIHWMEYGGQYPRTRI